MSGTLKNDKMIVRYKLIIAYKYSIIIDISKNEIIM